jgi:hypothetical protein
VGNPSRRDEMCLHTQVMLKSFDKWDIDFVGPINPSTRRLWERYIITMTEHLKRWAEATLVIDYSADIVV